MASICKLCDKKIGFFDDFSYVDGMMICSNCHKLYIDTINDFDCEDDFEDKLAKLQEQFGTKEEVKIFIQSIRELHELKRHELISSNTPSTEIETEVPKINSNIGPFENQDLVYSIEGVRGKHIDIYTDKVVINTRVTLGSLIAKNATDGEKTVYYSDCVGVQFKKSNLAIGYLQLETASSHGNNNNSNFFAENSFTFDTSVISNERMVEVADYVKARVDAVKKSTTITPLDKGNSISIADELLKLKQLLDMGILTQEEFDTQKHKLLNQ